MIPRVRQVDDPELPGFVLEALETGLTLVFPTETVYGIGGNPWDETVLERVREAKGRSPESPFTLHLPSIASIDRYAHPSPAARRAIDRLLPGPYTLLLPASESAPRSAVLGETVGVRVPNHPFFLDTVAQLDRPLFGTSVNRSGEPPLCRIDEIIDRFGWVDLIVEGVTGGEASTILDLTVDPPKLVLGALPQGL